MAALVVLETSKKDNKLYVDIVIKAGLSAYGLDLRIQYDQSALAYTQQAGGTLTTTTGWVVLANEPLAGLVVLAALDFSMQSPLGTSRDATLAKLVFDLKNSATTNALTVLDARYTNAGGSSIVLETPSVVDVQTGNVAIQNKPPVAADLKLAINEDEDQSGFLPQSTDPDGDPVLYSVAVSPRNGTLEIKTDGRYRYTPAPDYWGPDQFEYIVADNRGGSNRYTVSIDIKTVNDAPRVFKSPADQQLLAGQAFSLILPSDTFIDIDSSTLSYLVVGPDGKALPSWLRFDPISRTLSGQPSSADLGTVKLSIVASDGIASAGTPITLNVGANNRAPTASQGSASISEDSVLSGRLPQAFDADGDIPVYSLTSSVSHGDIELKSDGDFRYSPKPNYAGFDQFEFSVSDGKGGSNRYIFTIDVIAVNDPPQLMKPIADRIWFVGERGSVTIPTETFFDPDSSSVALRVSGAKNGSLPAWLAFDARANVLSGQPNASQVGTILIEVSASDGALAASTSFKIQIDPKTLGTPAADRLNGGMGNDMIVSGGGNDTIDGGEGIDTIALDVKTEDVIAHAKGSVVDSSGLRRLASSIGVLDVTSVERLKLLDGLYAFDTQPPSAGAAGGKVWQIGAIFGLAFGRLPTSAEFGQWIEKSDAASSMAKLGQSMLDAWAPGVEPAVLASYLYQRLTGQPLGNTTASAFVDQSVGSGKTYETNGDLLAWAASLDLNAVNLVGLNYSIQRIDGGT
ncbi:MAG: tandem-95 repeat protein [Betaproteobacteria bacterium]|nr:tandem-95 repeat protein [Betaproteobacteria bacterium]